MAEQGNELDLSRYQNNLSDVALVLGPMYHLYSKDDKLSAQREAVRVTKPGDVIFVAYTMNEPTVISFCFQKNQIRSCLEKKMLTADYHCISQPQDLFEMVRTEEIVALDARAFGQTAAACRHGRSYKLYARYRRRNR